MRRFYLVIAMTLTLGLGLAPAASVYDYQLNSIDFARVRLADFKGKVLMFVNVASRCGYTPQYAGLEQLYRKHKQEGFIIIGVPANNFGQQEPGSNPEIKSFCKRTYDVTFPMMWKVSVAGNDIIPLYEYLTDTTRNPKTGGPIKWNFTKFLVGRNGTVLARFEPDVTPEDPALVHAVEKALSSVPQQSN